jgi:hypothetical protein
MSKDRISQASEASLDAPQSLQLRRERLDGVTIILTMWDRNFPKDGANQ